MSDCVRDRMDAWKDLPLRTVRRIRHRLPRWLDDEEAEAAALVGLWKAARDYDPLRHRCSFRTFAAHRIEWAIFDCLRSHNRRTLKQGIEVGQLDFDLQAPDEPNRVDLADEVEPYLASCDRRKNGRRAVELYYLDDRTMEAAGEAMGLTEAAVSRILADCLKLMRQRGGRP